MNPANGSLTAHWTRLKQSLTRRGGRKAERSLSPDPVWVHVNSRRVSSSRRTQSSCTTRPSLDLHSPISFDPPPIDRSHNEKLPISRLPPEILADIFLILCEAGGLPDYSWTACSQVCAAWRAIALDTPVLWSHVIFSTSGWTRRCIERSKSAPLIVEANMTYTGLEDRVCGVLKLSDRIWKINLQFFAPSPLAITLLNGPFPILRSLSVNVSNYFLSPTLTLNPDAYPMLRHLHFRSNVTFFPCHLPTGLVSLEISNGSDGGVSWEIFAQSLQSLPDLEVLTLHEFAVPPTSAARIPLPALRELHLSACPAECARLVEALDAPLLRRYGLHLRTVDDAASMFATVLGGFADKDSTPKSMFLHRQYGTLGSDQWYHVSQPFPDPGFYQHTVFGFAYADARDAEVATLDICFTWRIPLTDDDLASIFSAIADIPGPLLEKVEWLLLADWNSSPPGTWAPFLRRLTGLKNLLISGLPASGLLWDLLDQLETPARLLVEKPLLPALEELEINSIDCSAGGWIPRRPQRNVNSYIDLDGARFIEVLICYLEARHKLSSVSSASSSASPPILARLKITRAINYTTAEIKLLRRLVGEVLWDGVGSMPSTYAFNGDEHGAMTINHNVLGRRASYRELEMCEEERWRRQFWALQMRG
ncbi:hypothetical protein FB45DRAFT_836816 [Roridomyces roridus]|uniref:F-box domain-containing protein n=1 Tax=Roridomyces roridus TaxID=1738132 RepID=A0AAD7BMC6_9AGAR|nr:hypothetical protein FB45DRAFT_836816 [Roridomyces roridus]